VRTSIAAAAERGAYFTAVSCGAYRLVTLENTKCRRWVCSGHVGEDEEVLRSNDSHVSRPTSQFRMELISNIHATTMHSDATYRVKRRPS
jgi:hypothetical protein